VNSILAKYVRRLGKWAMKVPDTWKFETINRSIIIIDTDIALFWKTDTNLIFSKTKKYRLSREKNRGRDSVFQYVSC